MRQSFVRLTKVGATLTTLSHSDLLIASPLTALADRETARR